MEWRVDHARQVRFLPIPRQGRGRIYGGKMTGSRSLRAIALDIEKAWPKVNYAARPYLDAMLEMGDINEPYGLDSGKSVVRYFLANANSFRGEEARAIKAELRSQL